MNRIFLTVLVLITQICFGIDCNRISKDEEYESSDIVFFGRVLDVNDTSYRIKVLESFKGSVPDTLIGVITEHNLIPREGTHWLIYAMTDDFKIFGIPPCNGSKSQERPFGLNDISFPEPPRQTLRNNPALVEVYDHVQRNRSQNEFFFEIESLREKVRKSELKSLKVALRELKQTTANNDAKITYLMLITIASLAVTIICLILWWTSVKRRQKLIS
jgi:hypothetical protein